MPVSVKSIIIWRKKIDNHVGVLARTLEPLQKAGADLQVVMAYRYPGNEAKAAVGSLMIKHTIHAWESVRRFSRPVAEELGSEPHQSCGLLPC